MADVYTEPELQTVRNQIEKISNSVLGLKIEPTSDADYRQIEQETEIPTDFWPVIQEFMEYSRRDEPHPDVRKFD